MSMATSTFAVTLTAEAGREPTAMSRPPSVQAIDKPLNRKQAEFIGLFLNGPNGIRYNASASARAAGYCPNSPHLANRTASRLMKYPHVKAAIDRIFAKKDPWFAKHCLMERLPVPRIK
jgi:hypothetical protein